MHNLITSTIKIIISYRGLSRFRLLRDYYKIVIKNRFNFSNCNREKILGFTIEFPYRPAFFGLLTEIFFRPLFPQKGNSNLITIIDCGANIGIRMIYYKWLYPNSTIICFEPNPINLDFLYRNIKNNNLTNIIIYPNSVGRETGRAELYYGDNIRGLGSGSLFNETNNNKNHLKIEVDVVKLSSYIVSEVYLLKLDIEGSEGWVIDDLEGNASFEFIRNIIIEFHYDGVKMNYPLSKIISKLEKAGYKCMNTPLLPTIVSKKNTSQTCMIYAKK